MVVNFVFLAFLILSSRLKVCLIALICCNFGVHLVTKYLRATKQNWVTFLTLKLIASHPLLYLLKLLLNEETNHFAFKTNHLPSIVLNWMFMLGNQANFGACAWPKMAVCWQSFLHCHLAFVSHLYFPNRAPKTVNRKGVAFLSQLFWKRRA